MSASDGSGPLPDYTVRVSGRARHVRLTVTARHGLTVVVPRGWRGDAAEVVASKRGWAMRALDRVAERRALHAAGAEALLPHHVRLDAIGKGWRVEYVQTDGGRTTVRERDGALVLSGQVDDAEACLAALRRWLDRVARVELAGRLRELSQATGLTPCRVRIAGQRSRWGSCSARGTVSLNRTLLFLPPELADSVILHELAHLEVLDHSERFWRRLSELDPDARAHRAALRDPSRFVPEWAHA